MRYHQIIESVEETQELLILAKHLAVAIKKLSSQSTFSAILGDFLAYTRSSDLSKLTLYFVGVPINKFPLPKFKSPVINKLVNDFPLDIRVTQPESGDDSLGSYRRYVDAVTKQRVNRQRIVLNLGMVETSSLDRIYQTIVHELQHAVDDLKSDGRALRGSSTDHATHDEYLRDRSEINARFTQALADLAHANPSAGPDLMRSIVQIFMKHKLIHVFDRGMDDPAYRTLLKRVYKFWSTQKSAPLIVKKPNLVKKLWAYATGNPDHGEVVKTAK